MLAKGDIVGVTPSADTGPFKLFAELVLSLLEVAVPTADLEIRF
jgi:hypothetical protein